MRDFDIELKPFREAVIAHPIFQRVNSIKDVQIFMSNHIFAVWDFMSLLKTLQRDLTCTAVPWFPPAHPEAARLINEIVLGEETDEAEPGVYCSHFELYRKAMIQAGASTSAIDQMFGRFKAGGNLESCFDDLRVPPEVKNFVSTTLAVCERSTHEVAAAFFYGREDVIPDMFERALQSHMLQSSGDFSLLKLYMRRHIELDGGSHGPRARRILEVLCGNDDRKWNEAADSARASLQARKRLWDGIISALDAGTLFN